MCGIAGIVTPFSSASPTSGRAAESGSALRAMTDSLARRGPDSSGIHHWPTALLGHRRLAIFDLSALGHQPMLSPDGQIGLVFNGAIYNFHNLRAELAGKGVSFVSQTDTEVILHGYREWGIDALTRRLDGMFAFALWDERSRRLFLVRDRLGVKPLYYVNDRRGFAFASTARALRAAGWAGELEAGAVVDFIEYGYITEERSIYTGVAKVPPATIVEFDGERLHQRSFWSLFPDRRSPAPFSSVVEDAGELLLEATRKRLLADVPVGALLSGGIDSALVCWAIKTLGADITAYSVAVPGDPEDESSDAVATAREIGIRHQVLPMSGMDRPMIDELINAYGEPFACSSALGMLRLSRAIAESPIKVLLTGDGGDDAFLGYDRHRMMLNIQRAARLLPGGATALWRSLRGVLPVEGNARRLRHFIDYHVGGLGAFLSATDGLPKLAKLGMAGERLAGLAAPARGIPWSVPAARDLLQTYLDYDRDHQFVSEYLVKVDGSTMFHALEARSPFLDPGIWEFTSRLPFETLLRDGTLKAVLRELAGRRISRRVAAGSKRGFSIPVERWLGGKWADDVRAHFSGSLLESDGWIHHGSLMRDFNASLARGAVPQRLWYLYVLEAWLRRESGTRREAVVAA
ncbi:MAG: asparagine synthase (glutamine-hydrolyzing) [Gemmatimonadota bacterium]